MPHGLVCTITDITKDNNKTNISEVGDNLDVLVNIKNEK